MEKSRAIDLLDNLIGMIEDNQDNDYDTAFRMAIEALKAQLSKEGTTSDLISRQAAIGCLRDGQICGDYCRKAIEQLPPAQPEPQWIPVERELPKESGYYITSNECNGVGEDFYYDGHFWNADKNAYSVIAWMPKPEHYKPNK